MKRVISRQIGVPFAAVLLPLLAFACSSAKEERVPFPDPLAPATPPPGPQPDFGPLVQADDPPPPISGGTLAIDSSGKIAVASDPDRDRIYVVDLPARAVKHSIELPKHAEPGRVAFDNTGHAYVALRQSGELATIDLATGKTERSMVCSAPRGVVFDAAKKAVVVACAGGELVTIPLETTTAIKRITVGRDLRDVLIVNGRTYVTKFREAQLVEIRSDGRSQVDPGLGGANLAWRSVAAPNTPNPKDPFGSSEQEATAVVSQDPSTEPVRIEPGGYGSQSSGLTPDMGDCGGQIGIVSTRLELIGHGSVRLPAAVLPVDLATNKDGSEFVVVAAGNAFTKELPQLFIVHANHLQKGRVECVPTIQGNVPGQAIAAAFAEHDALIVQTREPAAIHIMTEDRRRAWKTITLATDSRRDTGHEIFHSNAGGFIACASCHAEGGDDAKAWNFVDLGPRRTPSLRQTLIEDTSFHWDGEMVNLRMLVDKVFVERMSGPKIDDPQVAALKHYMFKIPAPPKARAEADAPARGRELFQQRCVSCHSGSAYTNGKLVDVGTGFVAKVPSLVGLAWRAPYIHTGCAATLFDRFDPACGGETHGDTRDLKPDQINDLVQYLETL